MSRSRRLPIIKDKPRNYNRTSAYWRVVRRVVKEKVRDLKLEAINKKEMWDFDQEIVENIPNPKEIVNDYDYSDYTNDYRFDNNIWTIKLSRK